MIKEAQRLHRLFQRGFLADSPDFIQEKQHDGRYRLKVRGRVGSSQAVSRHIPTGLIKSVTLEGYAGPHGSAPDRHYGPATWTRILDGLAVTVIGQFNLNPIDSSLFQAGDDYPVIGFSIRSEMGIWHPGPTSNLCTLLFNNADLATDTYLSLARNDVGQSLGPGYDLSSGDLDTTLTSFGIDWRFVVHIEWDR